MVTPLLHYVLLAYLNAVHNQAALPVRQLASAFTHAFRCFARAACSSCIRTCFCEKLPLRACFSLALSDFLRLPESKSLSILLMMCVFLKQWPREQLLLSRCRSHCFTRTHTPAWRTCDKVMLGTTYRIKHSGAASAASQPGADRRTDCLGLPCSRSSAARWANAPEHFQRKAPGAPLAGIDFGCNIQQLGHCNVPLAVAPFPYSSVPWGNGLRRRRASRRAPNPLRPRSVIQTRKTQKKMGIRYYFARQYRKFTVEGPVAGGLALVWLGYGRSGLGIVTWENSKQESLL